MTDQLAHLICAITIKCKVTFVTVFALPANWTFTDVSTACVPARCSVYTGVVFLTNMPWYCKKNKFKKINCILNYRICRTYLLCLMSILARLTIIISINLALIFFCHFFFYHSVILVISNLPGGCTINKLTT